MLIPTTTLFNIIYRWTIKLTWTLQHATHIIPQTTYYHYWSARTKTDNNKMTENQLKVLTKGLFTWKWGTQGRWGNPLRWGNLPVHIIAHFNLITFTWYVGRPTKVGITVCQGNPLSWQQICHVNVSRWGYLPSWGQIRNTSNLGKIRFGGGFTALLKVTIDSNSTEGCSRSSKWV